jgi:hypothetical protein
MAASSAWKSQATRTGGSLPAPLSAEGTVLNTAAYRPPNTPAKAQGLLRIITSMALSWG